MTSTIGIVSLSSGIIGEDFVKHEVDLGVQRLKDLGLNPIFLPHSLKGLDFIKEHPEARVEDLIQAFSDDSIDMILCAIGGDDTYRLLPYLFENDQLQKVIKQKIFNKVILIKSLLICGKQALNLEYNQLSQCINIVPCAAYDQNIF